jgi:YjbE family integral membrane protein
MLDTIWPFVQIIFADIVLSGDNALVIGMAAANLPEKQRRQAIVLGMALAAGLRILFAIIASFLIGVPGLLFVGGLLLVWVCWRFYGEIRNHIAEKAEDALEAVEAKTYTGSPRKQLFSALITITIADVSMSLDNVLAVAGIARDNTSLLISGLALAIILMAFFASLIMRVMVRFPALAWVGLAFLIYIAGKMLFDGWLELAAHLG